jgi:predicted secreted protein
MHIVTRRTLAPWLVAGWALSGLAAQAQSIGQTLAIAAPQNVVSLSAEASREVLQDRLSITMSITREGAEAAAVQTQLRQALDSALVEARKAVRPNGALDVRTGAFSLTPRYTAKPTSGNNISGWQGRAELQIEGSDIAAISQLAGRLNMLTVSRVAFSLSREAREKTEADVAAQAIGRFKERADAYAKHFGFGGYSLREVTVNGGEIGGPSPAPVFRAQAMSAKAGDEVQPVEAGKTTVSVTVAGSIQLSPR